jgi:hypothetical protein
MRPPLHRKSVQNIRHAIRRLSSKAGPHLICYRCDLVVSVGGVCPDCEDVAYVAPCGGPRICGPCTRQARAQAESR